MFLSDAGLFKYVNILSPLGIKGLILSANMNTFSNEDNKKMVNTNNKQIILNNKS